MNEQERIELLKAVAECALKEMGAFYDEGCTSCDFAAYDERIWFTLDADQSDVTAGPAIIAMLDAMRKRESELTQLVATHSDKELSAMACEHAASELFRVRAVLNELTWRNLSAEAVSRAFVAVFGGGK